MRNKLATLSIVASAFLTFTSAFAGDNLIQNRSFLDYSIQKKHEAWREIAFNSKRKAEEAWNGNISKFDNHLTTVESIAKRTISLYNASLFKPTAVTHSSMLQTSTHLLSIETIPDIEVTVASHTERPLKKDERVRGSSIWLKVEDGVIILENRSYRQIKSLLGKYQDENGEDILLKLDFNQNILPYSRNVLDDFLHASKIEIVHTAGHFDMQLSFGGEDCDANTPTDKTLYCTPTTKYDEIYSEESAQNSTELSEQQVYSMAMATYHHLYNSIDGLNVMKAWVEGKKYKELDYTKDYQSSESYLKSVDDKMRYLHEKYFRITMPNNHVKFSAMRYQYAAEGMGGGYTGDLLGTKSGGSFASTWEGSIKFDNNRLLTYDTVHHEAMHAIGFAHVSGMTYGWSYALREAINRFYTVGENPVVDVPNYVFETKIVNKNQIQLSVYKTSEATNDEVTFEILSATPVMESEYSMEQSDIDESNQLTLTLNREQFRRFFIRLYGSDSDEIMSKMVYLSN